MDRGSPRTSAKCIEISEISLASTLFFPVENPCLFVEKSMFEAQVAEPIPWGCTPPRTGILNKEGAEGIYLRQDG